MPVVTIVKEFMFQHADGYKEVIPPGTYELDDELANHFYVKAHSDNPPPKILRPGMAGFEAQMNRFAADQSLVNAQGNQVSDLAGMKARQEFKKANAQVRQRRPNQRPTVDEAKQDPAQEERDEHEEMKRVAESMGQKLPEDAEKPESDNNVNQSPRPRLEDGPPAQQDHQEEHHD